MEFETQTDDVATNSIIITIKALIYSTKKKQNKTKNVINAKVLIRFILKWFNLTVSVVEFVHKYFDEL